MSAGLQDAKTYITYESVLFGIVIWDWLVCLGQEYKHVWKAKVTIVKLLYLMCRYISLVLTSIVFGLNYVDQPVSTCNLLVRFNCAAIMVIQSISLAVLAQRAYYVSLRSKAVAGFLTLFILALVALGITHAVVAVQTSPAELVDGHGVCRVQVLHDWKGLTAAFFALPVVGHAVATVIILVQTRRNLPHNGTLRRLLVVDGLLYLLAVDAIGLVQFIFFLSARSHQLAMMNAPALLSLTSVFCCRFILHMREKSEQVSRANSGKDWTDRPDWTNNFGAPVDSVHKSPKTILSGLTASAHQKHRLSRLQDTGCAFVTTLPELLVDDSENVSRQSAFPLQKVEIRQDVLRKVDTISLDDNVGARSQKTSYQEDTIRAGSAADV